MIRPITIVTFLMACGSGLYLYQSKHEVQLLDRTIEKTVRESSALREQSRLLSAEWTMLNDPERLRQFSDTYLNLKSINPAQFTSLNDLDSRLPAPRIEAPAVAPLEGPDDTAGDTPVAGDPAPASGSEPALVAQEDVLPVPPIPAARPVQVATPAAHPVEPRVALARPAAVAPTEAKPVEPRAAEPRPAPRLAEVRPEVRPEMRAQAAAARPIVLAAPRPQPVYAPPAPMAVAAHAPVAVAAPTPVAVAAHAPVAVAAPTPTPYRPAPQAAPAAAPYSGSLLGMARGSMPAAPRPLPVNATYNAN